MTDSKEQKIVVLTELKPSDNTLILNGIKIASVFNKELCLVYNYRKKEKKHHSIFKQELKQYLIPIKKEVPGLKISTLLLSENWSIIPDILADEFEAIFLIANSQNFKQYSKVLSESSVPMLFVRPNSKILDFNQIVQPIDLRKENSDSSLWCSYFGRFNNAEIVVIAANDNGKYEKRYLAKNVELTKKLYQKFKIRHKIFKGDKSSFRNSFEALDLALASDCNLLTILGSSAITPLDLLIGLPERKIIQRAGNLPVLVINPRKDNYILCD
ncbi:hypothetical protein OU798_20490 [Prolixibacteraceae bacterium Z1-6]|uniref:Universal stress protein family protein n=1 Tax=Draconibacterium aestuarii TaxID=2998507 RepID=A0A9X3F995_9BACT|nr:hypothetical protein [Prolixibacteraceae bacterium Z1-6]